MPLVRDPEKHWDCDLSRMIKNDYIKLAQVIFNANFDKGLIL